MAIYVQYSHQKSRQTGKIVKMNVMPVIDLQDSGDNLKKKLREACEEWGCFRLTNHRIDSSLMAEMKKAVRSLLDLPGSVPKIARFCFRVPGHFLRELGTQQHGFLSRGSRFLSSPNESDRIIWESNTINKYDFTPETKGSCGVQTHADLSFIAILQDDENVGGLQVINNESGSFVDVPPCPRSFFAILGDIAHGDIESPEELVDSNHHPRLFLLFSYEYYRNLRMSQKIHAGESLALIHVSMISD
ncbi:2-oxoglutarate-dependent dioxygenase DAO-like [Prosopis cineraria]|uniref:2-oxoglutarate-dependent dioxygenase DAO-like n=1 Tax=Prosopis cineraria TaxID=364024 RepID=UPI00240F1FFD|nr:2-oxoglutarate-dependent dioxygenase DAO-like [Prosopis cineraria]